MGDNVLGPFTKLDWNTLRLLNRSIKYMRNKDPVKFSDAIKKEKELYKEFLSPYLSLDKKQVNE
jgi:hypothetical protein